MAQVPVTRPGMVQRNPLPNQRLRAFDNDGGAFGGAARGMQQLGGALSDYATTQQQLEEQIADAGAKTLEIEWVKEAQALRNEMLSRKGLNAAAIRPQLEGDLQKLGEAYRERATTPIMRRMLGETLDARATGLLGEIDAHVRRETDEAKRTASAARSQMSAEEALATTDPDLRQRNIETGIAEIVRQNRTDGVDPAETEAQVFRYTSAIHSRIAAAMLTADKVDDALAYVDAHADELSADDEGRLRSALKDPLERRETDSYVNDLMGRGTAGDTRAPFSYADPVHGAGRPPVKGGQFNAARDYGGHHGVDIPAPMGTAVYSTAPGTAKVSKSAKGGNIVTVTHGDGSVSKYMHLGAVRVKDGDKVGPDTVIGAVGMTGRSTGPHVHWEVWKDGKAVDPQTLVGKQAVGGTQEAENSPRRHDLNALLGAIDRDASLTPEQRDRFKAEVERRVSRDEQLQARVEEQARRGALDQIAKLGPDNFTSMDQLPTDVRSALSPQDRVSFMSTADANRKERERATADLSAYNAMIGQGGGWNQFDPRQRDAVEAAVKAKGGSALAAFGVWEQTGILAKSGAVALRGGLVSTNAQEVRAAANIAGNMLRRNPNAFAGVEGSSDIEKAALAFNHYVYDLGMPPQQAAARVAQENTPEFRTKVKFGQAELDTYRKNLRKNGADDAARALGGVFNSREEAMEANTTYAELTIENLRSGHDLSTSQAMATAQMRKIYAPSRFGKLRKYAAELAYPAIGGSHEYLYTDARDAVKTETGVETKDVRLVPIPGITDEDIRNGRTARYRILYSHQQDGQSVVNVVPGLWAADMAAATKAESEKRMRAFMRDRAQIARGRAEARRAPPLALPSNPGAW
ncbi:M23 family metallopeptidase [Sphingomonas sp. DG1-23]|uniref:M23 family metallopeptidase n=1 Tax=Sphingomonas sp. DG1-23 TaxID=3068316 RepID=UPI00273FD99E|nr:M23 family metallopeptidase [Sphingomonas sp. DG1-23]MDP5279906.1 M23 family metallopeptidase [Sphingomonas sp. DG1-23]